MVTEQTRRKRIEGYLPDIADKEQQETQSQQLNQLQENIAALETVAKKIMSKEAVSRYGNLKLAHPETALKAVILVAQAAKAGYKEINDDKFKEILIEIKNQEI